MAPHTWRNEAWHIWLFAQTRKGRTVSDGAAPHNVNQPTPEPTETGEKKMTNKKHVLSHHLAGHASVAAGRSRRETGKIPRWICVALFAVCQAQSALAEEPLPNDNEYVVVDQNGHLSLNGGRVRFWGGIGGQIFPAVFDKVKGRESEMITKAVDRIEAYGFNMMRVWNVHRAFDAQPGGYTKGDRSMLDLHDEQIAEMKKRGIRLWCGSAGDGGLVYPEDVDVIDDPDTAEAWKEAVASLKGKNTDAPRAMGIEATMWDPRLEAITIRNNHKRMTRMNHHTGLRIADDPAFAVWELTNEQWWIQRMVGGNWQKLPNIFKDSLLVKWHEFLKEKYKTEEALLSKWGGYLPGESLEKGTILLAPMRNAAPAFDLNDTNPQARAKLDSVETKYGRDDVTAHRSRDVNEFFATLLLGHKKRVADAFKQTGKAARLSPLLWDTGMGFDGINQLMHQNADAVSYCAYIGGVTDDESSKRYPWNSGLEEPPRICKNVPWLEHNKVEGKPFFVYETNIGSPAKYRAEFPFRLLFLATIQDWDVVMWHSLSGGYWWDREDPIDGPLSSPGQGAAQFNFQHDELLISAIHTAGKMFTGLHLTPAPKPTKFIFGRNTIFGPDSMDYAGSYGRNGDDMMNTCYRFGSRIEIDLNRDDDEIVGRTVRGNAYGYPRPLMPTDQMIYDWHRGNLRIESPANAAFTGFLAQYGSDKVEFKNGIVFSDVSVENEPGAPYPITPEENFVTIAVTSSDGKTLKDSRTAVITALGTSANTGLEVGPDPAFAAQPQPGNTWQAMKVLNRGTTPVIFSRVNCTIKAPDLAGMRYTMRNWHWDIVEEGEIKEDGVLTISAKQPVFIIQLERLDAGGN